MMSYLPRPANLTQAGWRWTSATQINRAPLYAIKQTWPPYRQEEIVTSFDCQSMFLLPSIALGWSNGAFLSLTTGIQQKVTWLLGNRMILGCLSQRSKKPFSVIKSLTFFSGYNTVYLSSVLWGLCCHRKVWQSMLVNFLCGLPV